MSIIYREDKGSPLTSQEIDGNFRELEQRLSQLEETQERSEGIGKISFQNNILTITGSFGTEFGQFPFPKPTHAFKGQWQSQTLYQCHDVVTQETGLYQCLTDHQSTHWSQDQDKWKGLLLLQNSKLPFFEKATLPKQEDLGKLAVLFDETSPTLIFFNGKSWQSLMKGEIL